ncbi:DUF4377 domain-containing protein [uncultured Aquimarina sp.]|uniref:DUF4377 domain-containing protein n=1 Tax=uncultured Aquimarina sp. TaxID=575652 RepID=UPI002604026D|nr:DUF4377 domain-containing protein [uncultured Aquimarina sp.]
MKKALFLLVISIILNSCNGDNNNDDSRIESWRINHYQNTVIFLDYTAAIQYQTDDSIDTEDYRSLYGGINGFEFENGFIQDIIVKLKPNDLSIADIPPYEITLIKVLAKTQVSPDTTFKIRLTRNIIPESFENWVFVDEDNNYSIINSFIRIDCESLCNELSTKINNQEQLTGVFTHGTDGEYILKEIINE